MCSTTNVEFVKQLGADFVIDYHQQSDFRSDGRFDVLLDAVGTPPFAPFQAVMNPSAVYITLLPSLLSIARAVGFRVFSRQRVAPLLMRPRADDLRYLATLVEGGRLRAVIDSTYSLEELAEAHGQSQMGRVRGKLSIVIQPT